MQTTFVPQTIPVEEVVFSLAIGATRDGKIIDTKDSLGAAQSDFVGAGARAFGLWFLDAGLFPPGNANLILQLANNTTPTAQTPTLTFRNHAVVAVLGGAFGVLSMRIPTRFARLRVEDTSGAANNNIYLSASIRAV